MRSGSCSTLSHRGSWVCVSHSAGRRRGRGRGGRRVRAGVASHRPARRRPRAARTLDTVDCAQQVARRPAPPAALVAQVGASGAGPRDRGQWRRAGRVARSGGARVAGAPGGARSARRPVRGAAARRGAVLVRGVVESGDRPATAPAARDREDAPAHGAPEVDGGPETLEGLGGMTDWLGLSAAPRTPRPELKGRVLARGLAPRRRWHGPLAAAAVITLAVGGGAWWAYQTI